MKTATEWLKEMYLPGYMGLVSEDYTRNNGDFNFVPREPPVTVLSDMYLTPRGLHIFLSQAGYCFVERLIGEGEFNDLDIESFRSQTEQGRLKLVELYQKFRKEVGLANILQGRLVLTRLRPGRIPIVRFDFEVGNRAITGGMTGLIAPKPMPQ